MANLFCVHNVTTGGTGRTLACCLLVGCFADAVMFDGALISFIYEDDFRCC